ncbi:hypothetical protein KPH14_012758 [Odynerus spinipes]|uniref:Nucleic-acid-binding protein from mobile element jockey n=1 Tax=Odynerus spinipes TaxID=1348599 RepID=A0AAD9R9D6_9HYME|nr:hypothetical protein KPH14_012758 [Odynerus spinipes]
MEGKLKRKKEASVMEVEGENEVLSENKRIATENDKGNNEKTYYVKRTNLYPKSHVGSAVVEVFLNKQFIIESKNSNMITISKQIVRICKEAISLKPRGHSRAEVTFKNGDDANDFVEKTGKNELPILTSYIPYSYTERKGIIKDLDLEHDINDIMKHSSAPCKILNVRRLNKKIIDKENNSVAWVPSDVVQIIFEGNTLPEFIKVYGLYNIKVEVYIEPLKTCFNCCGYGHTKKICKKEAICWTCGGTKHGEDVICPKVTNPTCFQCQGEHRALSKLCDVYKFNLEVKEYMAYNAVSIYTALEICREKYNFRKNNININKKTLDSPGLTKENFPQLRQTSQTKNFELRKIGGIKVPDGSRTNVWN